MPENMVKKNIEAIKGSLAKFGQQKPIVVNKDNVVVAGNGTLEAARQLGWKEINVVRTNLTGAELTAFASVHPKGHSFNSLKAHRKKPLPTIVASYGQGSWAGIFHWNEPRQLTIEEYIQGQSFPDDFNFLDQKPVYVLGMSVPPFMIQRIANQISIQFLKTNIED